MRIDGLIEVEQRYFNWLLELIDEDGGLSDVHLGVLQTLHLLDFRPFVKNDDNRAIDGLIIRERFLLNYEEEIFVTDVVKTWLTKRCSFLEMLIGLSERAEYSDYGVTDMWFWRLLDNLGLLKYTDSDYLGYEIESAVKDTVNRVNDRTYDRDGQGGIFPLKNPTHDQRKVEIWFQMGAYILENGLLE